jgi:hypothetical protein
MSKRRQDESRPGQISCTLMKGVSALVAAPSRCGFR